MQHADAIQVADRTMRMRRVFSTLFHRPSIGQTEAAWLIGAIDRMHARNVTAFGWQMAEELRAHAFADASASPIPTGEAVESDLAAFDEVKTA